MDLKNPIGIDELGQPFKALLAIQAGYKKYAVRVLHLAAVSAWFYHAFRLPWPLAVLLAAAVTLPPYPGSPWPGAVLAAVGAVTVWQWPVVLAVLACFSWIIVFWVCVLLFMYLINSGLGPKI